MHRHLTDEINPHYETASELILGIELKTRGRKIAWNLKHYLDTMEEHALRTLEQEAQRKTGGKEKGQADTRKKREKVKNLKDVERQPPQKGKTQEPGESDEDGAP